MIREILESFLIAAVIAFFLITFVVQSFVVSGQSMVPTLENGERLMVNKFIHHFREPKRGEIVVFTPQEGSGQRYIKRVIGLPGDELVIDEGLLYINGERVEEDYINEPMNRTFGSYTVPEDHIFVMGDNRKHSTDSRWDQVGYIPYENVIGQAFWAYWPVSEIRWVEAGSYPQLE